MLTQPTDIIVNTFRGSERLVILGASILTCRPKKSPSFTQPFSNGFGLFARWG